jgi:hypothetical protein
VNFLTRLWPFPGGDVATAVPDLLTAPDLPFALISPIPLSERQPEPSDLGGIDGYHCWWGHWQGNHWLWTWDYEPVRDETHWLPATAQLLPARCCPPEVHP